MAHEHLNAGKPRFDTPLSRAPAFLLLLGLCVFFALRAEYGYPFWAALLISVTASAGWGIMGTARPNKASGAVMLLLLLFAAAGMFYISRVLERQESQGKMPNTAERRGTVTDVRRWGYGRIAVVDSPDGRYVLRFRGDDDLPEGLSPGDIVVFSGAFEPFKRAEKAGEFDEFLYWRARGAVAALAGPSVEIAGTSRGITRWRAMLEKRIKATLPPRTAGYALASLVGRRDASLETLHRSAGTSHLLAVSGAHVVIVCSICWYFLRRLKARLYILSAAIWFYVAMTGLGPGAVRAALMIQLAVIGKIIGRSGKTFNTVSLAGVLMLLHNPWIFWDVGWRFSMLAALAITSVTALDISREIKIFLASVMAWLATAMQAAWTFDRLPVVGILANFFAIPVFTALFPIGFAFSLPSMLGAPALLGRAASAVPEFLFARWEQLSNNLLMLCPWQMPFSIPLLLTGVSALTFFFAAASGYEKRGAALAAAINILGLCALLLKPI